MISRKIAAAMVLGLALTSTGCASFWKEFRENPVQKSQTLIQQAQVVQNMAVRVFEEVMKMLPPEKQAIARPKFERAIFTVDHSIGVLNSALTVAAEMGKDTPDIWVAIAALQKAVADVMAIIEEYRGQPVAGTVGVSASDASYIDLKYQVDVLNRLSPKR